MKLYLTKMNEVVKEKYDSKLVLLIYNDFDNYDWSEIEALGIKVINVKDLTKEDLNTQEYQLENKFHPNNKAWHVVAPALAKELKLE